MISARSFVYKNQGGPIEGLIGGLIWGSFFGVFFGVILRGRFGGVLFEDNFGTLWYFLVLPGTF